MDFTPPSSLRRGPASIAVMLGAAVGLFVGCGHAQLMPADSANLVPGAPDSAFDEESGIRVAVTGDEWQGDPKDLTDHMTPVKVRVVNRSGHPIQILYEHFWLAGAGGRTYHPLPVVPLEHQGRGARVLPIFASANFFVGPRYRDVYPSLDAWPNPLPRDEAFYEHQYRRWGQLQPTREILRSALPEGVLGDGGEISGYLYFENATRHEDHLKFKGELDEGRGGEVVASVDVPMRVN